MDSLTLDRYRQIIESILIEYTKIPYAHSEIQTEAVFDRVHDRYMLVNTGWEPASASTVAWSTWTSWTEKSGSSATAWNTVSPGNSSPRGFPKSTSYWPSGRSNSGGIPIMRRHSGWDQDAEGPGKVQRMSGTGTITPPR